MKLVICGSMTNYLKMLELKTRLESMGHEVITPDPAKDFHLKAIAGNNYIDTYQLKIKYDYIRKHYNHIVNADSIIIANYDKNGVKNYIGGNAFLEMGFAHILDKPIYLLNPIPTENNSYHEMMAMRPIILHNKLSIFSQSNYENK